MKIRLSLAAAVLAVSAPSAFALTERLPGFLGQIITTSANFCPQGWTELKGQVWPLAQNTALFSLLGTTYGGDGASTFGLPSALPLLDGKGTAFLQCMCTQQMVLTVETCEFPSRE